MAQYTNPNQTEMIDIDPTNGDTNRDHTELLRETNDQKQPCDCYKRWNTLQFIIFIIVLIFLTALLVGIFSNIDRMGKKSATETKIDTTASPTLSPIDSPTSIPTVTPTSNPINPLDYCDETGIFAPPPEYSPPTPPDGWTWSYEDNNYNGPQTWKTYFPQCGCQTHQAPRDIDTVQSEMNTPSQLCSDNSSLLQWTIDSEYIQEYNGTFEVFHNAHTIQMKNINYENDSLIPIGMLKNLWQPLGSDLHSYFRLEQIHFHWGNDNYGSPHTINGQHYPFCIHFVHYSTDYDSLGGAFVDSFSLDAAGEDRYVLAVVGIFFEIDETNQSHNPAIDQLLSSEVLNSPNDEDQGFVERINLEDFLPHDRQSYYYYPGSISTPPCVPIVRWHLLSTPLKVNADQIKKFQSIANETVTYNSRPVQENTNPVYACHAKFFPNSS